MHTDDPEFKSHFALKVKLKALHLFGEDLKDALRLKFRIYYDGEDERSVRLSPERVGVINVFNRDYKTMLKSIINKSIYLPIVCLRGTCPQFINIICSIGKGRELGLKLYLNKNYAFLKYYGTNKLYSIYDCNNGSVRGHLELAMDIVNCNRSVPYFGNELSNMGKDDHYILATEVSVSKLWKEMVGHRTNRDVDTYVESFRIMRKDGLRGIPLTGRKPPLSLFSGSAKHAYEEVPLPLISPVGLFDYFYMEVLPLYKKSNPSWIRVVNDAYDRYLYRHFQVSHVDNTYRHYNKKRLLICAPILACCPLEKLAPIKNVITCSQKKDMYEEIRACALFFYLESVFVKVAASFAKCVIIQEYTKYTSPRYFDKLLAGKPNHRIQLDDDFKYVKISGEGPLDVFKLFDGDEVYVTQDSYMVGEGLIGILIFGDDRTDTDLACKKYNREIKAQQWINKGIAKVKSQNLKGLAKECRKGRMDGMQVSLSLLSFNLSALVSYKGFKMYVIPSPAFPLEVRRLDAVSGDLKHELRILEKAIPTYALLRQVKGKEAFLAKFPSEDNYVFYNINTMFVGMNKRHFPIFEEPQGNASHIKEQNNQGSYKEKSFYSNDMKVRRDLDLYCEDAETDVWGRGTHAKNSEKYIERVLREMESLSSSVPFDSTSLKMYLHERGLKMKHLGKMLSCVSHRWLYDMLLNEVLIRCIKKYVYLCMREICMFCKRRITQYGRLDGGENSASELRSEIDFSVESDFLSDEVSQLKGETSMPGCYDSGGYRSTSSETSSLRSGDTTEGTSEGGYRDYHYELRKRGTKRELCSRNKALKSFIGMRKILSRKVLLRTHLESALGGRSNANRGASLLSKLLNFDSFKKYSRNGDMYILKRKKVQGSVKIVRKKCKGNVTLIDVFVVNLFNVIFAQESGIDGDLLAALQSIAAKFFNTSVGNLVEAAQKNYLYANLQPCLGISFYRAGLDQQIGKRNLRGGKFSMHHLKKYRTKIKRSINVTYMDLPAYKYTHRHERIPLDVTNENKKILSSAIFFTIMFYHHSAGNEVYTRELFPQDGKLPRGGSYNEEDPTSRHNRTCTVRSNSLIPSEDSITFHSDSNYLPLYGFLNMVSVGVQLGFFESALKRLIAILRYIPENSVISVHVRIMWLYVHALRGKYAQGGHILGDNKVIENRVEKPYKTGNRKWVPHPFGKNSVDEESRQGSFSSVSGRGVFLHDDETVSHCADCSACSNLWSDALESEMRQINHDENSHWTEEDQEISFHHGDELDLYKGTEKCCSVILNNYFVFFHPMHLDFYLSLAWYNRSVNNYREFLLLLRTVILLQLKMRLKSHPGERIEDVVNLKDNFENLVYFKMEVSSNRGSGLREKEYVLLDRIRNVSSFFLNSICYPHEDLFIHTNLETTMKFSSVYSIRLGCTVHHFANSLFYYYYTNRVIRKYRNEDFILNGSLCCISVLEHVRDVYLSCGVDNVYVGEASLDLALMALKTYLSEMPEFGWNCVMAYALGNARRAAETFRRNLGINHPDTLHSHYILSLVYMYLDSEKCLHTFEEIIYHLLNYKYSYGGKNVLNRVYCYVPDLVLTDEELDSTGRIPNRCRIKWYLLHSWFSICMPIKYLRKIRRILFLLFSVERCRRKSGSTEGGSPFQDGWVKRCDDLLRGNVLWDCSKNVDGEHIFSYEQLVSCIRGYKHIFPLQGLFSQMEEYNDLLKCNRNVVVVTTSRMDQCEDRRGVATEEVSHNGDDIRLLPLLLSRVDVEQDNRIGAFSDGFVKSAMKHKTDFANYVHHPDFRNDEAVENYLKRETQEDTIKKRQSVTDYYLKKLIRKVEQQVELLYKEEKYKHDTKLHLSNRANKPCASLASRMKKVKTGVRNNDTRGSSLIWNGRATSDSSEVDTVSFLSSNNCGDYSDVSSTACGENSSSQKRNHPSGDKGDRRRTEHVEATQVGKVSDASLVRNDVHVLMSLLYHFFNVGKFHQFYSRAADGE
ncbi:Uncharacterized protein PCOAH_00018340 [Plasmodium coatneyi]|uniref:Clu domain-containing protein n=1 Tax=Plasmodium coatneyi TaxID=208452 RepID=A0A1B1DXQ5_9APIC|nr:Uncharacterized protein PCOAH_00018340 [Plasmodium coatneyi]ANQ07548.1 Uncharacterized protein PCOAH_00018340 [Plasmodium coatneyi]